MYWDTISDQWPWFIAAGLVVVLLAVFAAYRFARSTSRAKTTVATEKKQTGWSPTGRIDFISTAPAGNFMLQVEDTRIVDSIGGVEHREIRWRSPTLDEVKSVLASYHVQRKLVMTPSYVVSASNTIRRDPTWGTSLKMFNTGTMAPPKQSLLVELWSMFLWRLGNVPL